MRTQDSTLAYFVNQLDNFDQTLHQPLFSVTWGRDIQLRTGISLANESTSFTRQEFGAGGSLSSTGMPWVSGNSSALVGVDVNGERIVTPLRPLAREVVYSSIELDRSQLTGQPVDMQKLQAFNSLYQMSTDQMVYIGDTGVSATGLINSSQVSAAGADTGTWPTATADEILGDINEGLTAAWSASGFAVCPRELRLPPAQYGLIATRKVSDAGNISILQYVMLNSIANQVNGSPLNIQPLKWLTGRGESNADRMMFYTNQSDYVRFPLVPVRRETAYYQGINFHAPYLWAYGEVEFVYPETVLYRDGI